MKDEAPYFCEIGREKARWTDLTLRAHYPCARTELWQIAKHSYLLFVPIEDLDADKHRSWFDETVRQVGCQIALTNLRVENAIRVPIIQDEDIGGALAAMPLTRADVELVLAGRFPALPPIRLANEGPGSRHYTCDGPLEPELGVAVQDMLQKILPGFDVTLEGKEQSTETPSNSPDSRDGLRTQPLSQRRDLPEFVGDEEAAWFANFEAMIAGEFKAADFPICRRGNATACFLPSSVGQTADLRQVLMAFDVVYLELPVIDIPTPGSVEGTFGISRVDLFELVQCGRARIVTRQPEERIDRGLLRELHEVRSDAVAGRRATAGVVVSDLVRTVRNSLFAQPEVRSVLPALSEAIARQSGRDNAEELRRLLLPETMLRRAVPSFLSQGISMIGSVGVGETIAKDLERLKNKDFRVEAYHFAGDIHLAHALGATLLPRPEQELTESWLPLMRGMGEMLNFHAGCTPEMFETWQANSRARDHGEVVLPPVPVFAFEDPWRNDTSLCDVLDVTTRGSDRTRALALISRLANLPPEARVAEADRLASEMGTWFGKRRGQINRIDFAGEAAGVLGIPLAGLLLKALSFGTERIASHFPAIDQFADAVSRTVRRGRNEDIDLLAKVHRVARLRVSKDSS